MSVQNEPNLSPQLQESRTGRGLPEFGSSGSFWSHFGFSSFRTSTLVGKLLCAILPVVLISLCAVAISCYVAADTQIRKGIQGHVQGLAEQAALNVEGFIQQRQRDMAAITDVSDPILALYYGYTESDAELFAPERHEQIVSLRDAFLKFQNRASEYSLLAHFDAGGQLLLGFSKGKALQDPKQFPLDYAALRDLAVEGAGQATPVLMDVEGRRQLVLVQPWSEEGRQAGGLTVLVSEMAPLRSVLERTRGDLGRLGGAYVAERDGTLIIGQTPDPRLDLSAEVRLQALPWRVGVQASVEEFVEPLVKLRDLTIFLSVLVTLGVTGLLIAEVRRATRPIVDMVAGTQRLSAGELDYRFPVPKLQELENLAVAFNDMAGNLKARSEALEERVNQLSALRMMEQTVIQGLDEESILRTTLRAVAKGLGFDRAGLYWVDEPRGLIVGRYSHFNYPTRFSEADFRKRTLKLGGQDILNQVIAGREAQLVKDPEHHQGVDMRYVREAGTGEFVMAPLCGQDHVYGVITADNCHSHRPLRESDREGLMLFASAAGMALENARLMSKVADSEARHRMVLESSPVAILGLSRDHRIVTWNRGAESTFGYSAQQMVGRPIKDLLPEEAGPEFDRLLAELIRAGAVRDYPIRGRTRTGELLDLTVSWGGKGQEFLSNDEWAVVIRDVTEARKLQGQLILSEKLSVVGQLIAGIAHELNNPLQAVTGYAQVLAESQRHASGADGDSGGRELRSIYENAKRCRRIIDNLLLFVRQGDVQKRPVSLRKAVDASLELLGHKLRRGQIQVTVVAPQPELYVNANFQQVEQVFINLINNACDAMADMPEPRRLDIRIESRDERAFVRVSDTGPGIPPDLRERVFEPFFTSKGEGRGTGLGLPLCKQIIREHGGELHVPDPQHTSGSEHRGAVFAFELELCAPCSEPQVHEPHPRVQGPSRKVFVVDDEPEVRSLLQDVLEAQGHEVTAAESLEQALTSANTHPFDLVVSDVHLNDGTGLELFDQWDDYVDYPRPRFLFLTGDIVSPSLEALCTRSQAKVLQKPMDLREFRAAVTWALADSQTHAEADQSGTAPGGRRVSTVLPS